MSYKIRTLNFVLMLVKVLIPAGAGLNLVGRNLAVPVYGLLVCWTIPGFIPFFRGCFYSYARLFCGELSGQILYKANEGIEMLIIRDMNL